MSGFPAVSVSGFTTAHATATGTIVAAVSGKRIMVHQIYGSLGNTNPYILTAEITGTKDGGSITIGKWRAYSSPPNFGFSGTPDIICDTNTAVSLTATSGGGTAFCNVTVVYKYV